MAVSMVHGRTSLPEGEDKKDVAVNSKEQLYVKPNYALRSACFLFADAFQETSLL